MNKHEIIKKKLKKDVTYKIQNHAISFLNGDRSPTKTAGTSLLGKIQNQLKKWSSFYAFFLKLFKPVWVSKEMDSSLKKILRKYGRDDMILNLGSGPNSISGRADIINVDLYAFDVVDIIADAENLPIEDESVDLMLNQAMLEHVSHPEIVVNEMYRLLRPGGEIFCYLPFVVPFHAAPYDYYRWTMPGVKELFKKYEKISIGIGAGPTSGMLWVLQEWFALFISFGSKHLHDIVFLILMVLLAPIKMLDILLVHHPYASKIASGFFITAKKKEN